MNFHSSVAALALACLAVAPVARAQTPAPAPAPTQAPAKLKVGDAAPALSIESFVKGTPVTTLEKGKTYLLHFWAPWNKASLEQLQILSEVQKNYADKKLVVIGIASTDVTGTTIEKVKTAITDKGGAVEFAIAWDKGTETKDAFLKAAGRSTLPCAVIVDKEGKVAFIENALLGLQFLDAVTAGTHDLAAMAAWQTKAERAPQTLKSLATAYQARKWAEVLSYSTELLEVDPVGYGGNAQVRMLAQGKSGAADKAIEWAKAWVDGPGKNSPEGLNAVAWVLVDPKEPFPKQDLDLALKAATRAAELTKNEDGAILDTVARVHFLKGDVAKAVEIQKMALLKLKPAQAQFKTQIEAALKEYEAALPK
ncbi:MAG: TlpA disulfide reductase family protein [Planctomycetota bacterium]|nr:TlpA disulfide reductase family protein [Planctomycetota bacterium]